MRTVRHSVKNFLADPDNPKIKYPALMEAIAGKNLKSTRRRHAFFAGRAKPGVLFRFGEPAARRGIDSALSIRYDIHRKLNIVS